MNILKYRKEFIAKDITSVKVWTWTFLFRERRLFTSIIEAYSDIYCNNQ